MKTKNLVVVKVNRVDEEIKKESEYRNEEVLENMIILKKISIFQLRKKIEDKKRDLIRSVNNINEENNYRDIDGVIPTNLHVVIFVTNRIDLYHEKWKKENEYDHKKATLYKKNIEYDHKNIFYRIVANTCSKKIEFLVELETIKNEEVHK